MLHGAKSLNKQLKVLLGQGVALDSQGGLGAGSVIGDCIIDGQGPRARLRDDFRRGLQHVGVATHSEAAVALLGPGMGRNPHVLQAAAEIVAKAITRTLRVFGRPLLLYFRLRYRWEWAVLP